MRIRLKVRMIMLFSLILVPGLILAGSSHSGPKQDSKERPDWRIDRADGAGHIRADRFGDIYHLRDNRGRIIGTVEDGIIEGERIVKDRRGRRIGVIKEK